MGFFHITRQLLFSVRNSSLLSNIHKKNPHQQKSVPKRKLYPFHPFPLICFLFTRVTHFRDSPQMAGTIVTYELVMLKFDKESEGKGYIRPCSFFEIEKKWLK